MPSKKIVGYYGSWATYRKGGGKCDVDDIDPTLFTHLIYSFVGIGSNGTVDSLDAWKDFPDDGGKDLIKKFNRLKKRNPGLKTLAAIGGWNVGSEPFSRVVNDSSLCERFVRNVVEFVSRHGFDGFDLDWEFPGQRGGSPSDKEAFTRLIRKLKSEFDKRGYILSAAISAGINTIKNSYDVSALGRYLDFVNVMTYDYHGSWEKRTGHNAPLSSIDSTVQYLANNGLPREKIILGTPTYGRSWTLCSSSRGVGASASGPGTKGPFVEEAGSLGYNEILALFNQGDWKTHWDDEEKVPYAYSGNQWVSFDNEKSIGYKAKYVSRKGLGGVMIWSIDTDDIQGVGGNGKYPLVKSIKRHL